MGLCAQIYLNFFNCKSSQLQKASHLFTEIIFHICTLVFCPMSLCSFDATLVPSYLRVYIWPFSDPFILKSPLVNIRQSLTCPFAERQISVITNNCNIIIKQYPYPQYPQFDEIIIHKIIWLSPKHGFIATHCLSVKNHEYHLCLSVCHKKCGTPLSVTKKCLCVSSVCHEK